MVNIYFRESTPIFPYRFVIFVFFKESNFDIFCHKTNDFHYRDYDGFIIFNLLFPTFSTNKYNALSPLAGLLFVLSLVIFNWLVWVHSMKSYFFLLTCSAPWLLVEGKRLFSWMFLTLRLLVIGIYRGLPITFLTIAFVKKSNLKTLLVPTSLRSGFKFTPSVRNKTSSQVVSKIFISTRK